MMPGLDGFELLRALRRGRAHPRSAGDPACPLVPARRRGSKDWRPGADDYLVKPFSGRELIARVQAQVLRAKVRSVEEAHALRLASIFEHAPVGVAILRRSCTTCSSSSINAYAAMIGKRSVRGKPIREALPELAGQGLYRASRWRIHVGTAVCGPIRCA